MELSKISIDEIARPSVEYEGFNLRELDPNNGGAAASGLTVSKELPVAFHQAKQETANKLMRRRLKGKPVVPKSPRKKRKKGDADDITAVSIDEHLISLADLASRSGTAIDQRRPEKSAGLSSGQADAQRAKFGPNRLTPPKQTPLWVMFLKQFTDVFALLLQIGGVLCFIGYALDTKNPEGLYLGIILWVVVISTALFAFVEEAKSSRIVEGFKKLTPQKCTVIRDGLTSIREADILVPGDIVVIRGGDRIPADVRVIYAAEFKVDNSSLTGEAEPQNCVTHCTDDNPLETHNLAFFGTSALSGHAVGVVIRTGDRTVIGQMADLATSDKPQQTPLQMEITRFIKHISIVALCMAAIFFGVGFALDLHWVQNIVFAIGIAVANVPEVLMPTVTVALTLTAQRMAQRNVLIKNLLAVETLGATTTICSDKTGTLTQNRMTVVHLWLDGNIVSTDPVTDQGSYDARNRTLRRLYDVAALCNRAEFDSSETDPGKPIQQRKTVGDASESALLRFAEAIHPVEQHRREHGKLFEVPFNSVNKWQLSVHETKTDGDSGQCTVYMKGAPERIIALCDKILIDGQPEPLTDEHQAKFDLACEKLAGLGERCLGMALLDLPTQFTSSYPYNFDARNFPTDGYVFVGLSALQDPPRLNVPDAIARCQSAGIRVIMVTGDHPLTAVAIARQIGILKGQTVQDIARKENVPVESVDADSAPAVVVKGSEIDSLKSADWDRILAKKEIVFARTSPQQKLLIVKKCQEHGEVVAVTGDGVNDSPALKQADLGCAMGISGSDVSKEAANIVLLDDNFASIVSGVEEGRIIFDNLKKTLAYVLSSNTPQMMPFLLFMLAQMPLALNAVLIQVIDLGCDLAPAIALAYERPETDIMKRRPRNARRDRLVSMKLAVWSYAWIGAWQVMAGYLNFFLLLWWEWGVSPSQLPFTVKDHFKHDHGESNFYGYDRRSQLKMMAEAQTAYFVGVVVTRIFAAVTCKTRKRALWRVGMKNWVLNLSLLAEFGIALFISTAGFLEPAFGTRPVLWYYWFLPLTFAFALLGLGDLRKWIIRQRPRGKLARLTYW